MATSRPREDFDTVSNKVKMALSLFDDCKTDASTDNDGKPILPTYSELVQLHWRLSSVLRTLFQAGTEFISPKFPFHDLIYKSYFLTDEILYEAILFSKVFHSVDEFHVDRRKYEGELVWVVEDANSANATLIFHHRIIYTLSRSSLEKIRANVQCIWGILKKRVGKNLTQAFSMPESIQGWSDAPSTSVAREGSVTDEVKKAMLDEVNSFKLDQRIKDQFAFDLKVLPDKDVHYWHTRLDTLRLCSNMAMPSLQESAELKQLPQIVANLEEMIGRNEAYLVSIAEQVKPNVENAAGCNKPLELKQTLERMLAEIDNLLDEKFADIVREDAIFDGISEDEAEGIDDMKVRLLRRLEWVVRKVDPDKVLWNNP